MNENQLPILVVVDLGEDAFNKCCMFLSISKKAPI